MEFKAYNAETRVFEVEDMVTHASHTLSVQDVAAGFRSLAAAHSTMTAAPVTVTEMPSQPAPASAPKKPQRRGSKAPSSKKKAKGKSGNGSDGCVAVSFKPTFGISDHRSNQANLDALVASYRLLYRPITAPAAASDGDATAAAADGAAAATSTGWSVVLPAQLRASYETGSQTFTFRVPREELQVSLF